MTTLLYGIILSALFSTTSLMIVIFRVSPLSSPGYAIPAFFVSLFLTVCTLGALAFFSIWKLTHVHLWDQGKLLSVSVRQGVFLGSAVTLIVLFHLLSVLTWWIMLLIIGVFVLVESALNM